MDLGHLREQLIRIQFRECIILVNPSHQFRKCNAEAIIQRAVCSHGHDGVVALEPRPVDFLALDHAYLQPRAQRDLNGGAATSPSPMAAWPSPIYNSAPGTFTGE